jgi:hypothetical protein
LLERKGCALSLRAQQLSRLYQRLALQSDGFRLSLGIHSYERSFGISNEADWLARPKQAFARLYPAYAILVITHSFTFRLAAEYFRQAVSD